MRVEGGVGGRAGKQEQRLRERLARMRICMCGDGGGEGGEVALQQGAACRNRRFTGTVKERAGEGAGRREKERVMAK